jgi:hypothetical protein
MTYNELQTAVAAITTATGDRPSDRKKATLQAFYDAHTETPATETATEEIAMTEIEPAQIEATEIQTAEIVTVKVIQENTIAQELAIEFAVTAIWIVKTYIEFLKWGAPRAFYAGVAAREAAQWIATAYTRTAYAVTHPGQAHPIADAQTDTLEAIAILTESAVITAYRAVSPTVIAITTQISAYLVAQATEFGASAIAKLKRAASEVITEVTSVGQALQAVRALATV